MAKTEEEVAEHGINELQLTFLAKLIFLEWEDCSTQTVFDLFDVESKYKLDISQLFVLFLLVCSLESRQQMHFLHKFGKATFDMMASRGQGLINDRLVALTNLIFDKSLVEIQRMLQRVGIERNAYISFNEFELFLFDCFRVAQAEPSDCRTIVLDFDYQTQSAKCYEQRKQRIPNLMLLHQMTSPASSINKCTLI